MDVGPVLLPEGWVAHVNQSETEAELEALRLSVARGRPFGAPPWVEGTAKRLGLQATLRRHGRPSKATKEQAE